MKKTKSKNIVILIVLIILIIVMLRAFIKSRANNVVEITANFKDNNSLLSDETVTLEAINEGESGYSITLPDIINTKRVSKYIITQKEITENTEENVTVDMLPGEKIYLTSEEFENLQVSLVAEYDFLEVGTQTLYNKKLIKNDSEDCELLSVSGYMFYDTEMQVNEADITGVESKIEENYSNSFLFGNYDIKLISDSQEYNPKDYEQTLDIKISANNEDSIYKVLEMQDDNIQELSDIIIENGIKNNLDSETIKKSIADYKKYLSESGLADEEVLKAISIIEERSEEYVKIAKSFKKAGLPIPTVKINDTENQKSKVKSDFHATHSNLESSSCAKTILTKRSCSVGRSQTIQQDSCGSGRGVSRSSC